MQHIPQGETRELELLPFDDALRLAQEPAPDYDVSRWLYVPKVYSEYRYIFGDPREKAPHLYGHQSLHRHPGPVR